VQTRLCTDGLFSAWSSDEGVIGCAPNAGAAGRASCRIVQGGVPVCSELLSATSFMCPGGTLVEDEGCPTGGTYAGRCLSEDENGRFQGGLYFYTPVSESACPATFEP